MSLDISNIITADEYNVNTQAVDDYLNSQEWADIQKQKEIDSICFLILEHFNDDSLNNTKKDFIISIDILEPLERTNIIDTLISKGYNANIDGFNVLTISC